MLTVQKWRNRRRRDDRANGAKITEAMKVGDITFPLRITVTPECFPSLNQSKEILFCIKINETKPFLCSYYRHVDYRRAVMKKWRKKRMACLPSISAPLSTTMSKLCSEWTIPPHIDMRCNYFSVHGQLALRAASIMECVHDSCSIYWMWWSAIIQAYPQYQRISTFHIFVWIVNYAFGVGHVRISSCSAAKDCVVDNLDSWIIVLSLRHIHMMWYVW